VQQEGDPRGGVQRSESSVLDPDRLNPDQLRTGIGSLILLYTLPCTQAGAEIVPRLDPLACDVIAGVKEPVASTLPLSGTSTRRPAAHLGFFHCHKGQAYNFPLVQTLLESSKQCGTRFIDYELLTDAPTKDANGNETGGKRTVGFGFLAGYSGMADGLAQLGTKLLAAKGAATPFLSLERPVQAGTVDKMRQELERVGEAIREGGLDGLESPVSTV
jgi:alpha-aminoadipic semialdehyde synthase